jgi:hypothetical protein
MAKTNQVSIPYLDPSVQHVGTSRLRALNFTQLREFDKTLVIQDNDKALAVLLKEEGGLEPTGACCDYGGRLSDLPQLEISPTKRHLEQICFLRSPRIEICPDFY